MYALHIDRPIVKKLWVVKHDCFTLYLNNTYLLIYNTVFSNIGYFFMQNLID
jgi:hypothetical protein